MIEGQIYSVLASVLEGGGAKPGETHSIECGLFMVMMRRYENDDLVDIDFYYTLTSVHFADGEWFMTRGDEDEDSV